MLSEQKKHQVKGFDIHCHEKERDRQLAAVQPAMPQPAAVGWLSCFVECCRGPSNCTNMEYSVLRSCFKGRELELLLSS